MEIQDNTSAVLSGGKTEQLYDLIIKECIEKLGSLLNEYPNEKHNQQYSDIKKRYHNPELKLAVIGEFNTGKSTFINYLLKKNYLTTDNIPTTVIPTYIRWDGQYNDEPVIKIKLAGDDKEYVIQKNRALLEKILGIALNQSDDLERITTNNDLIGIISHVTVSFPADKRFTNFCLIDTPGVNPGAEETKEHVNVTREVLREEADATIILFPAHTTGNRSALEFISENASHLLDGASFVITKTDMIDSEKELDHIVKYMKGLVKQRYDLDNQTIYTCSSKKAILAHKAGNTSDPYLLQFDHMIDDILKSLAQKRKQIILKKVSGLLNTVLSDLRDGQKVLSKKLEDDIKLIEKYSLNNLEKEYSQLYNQLQTDLNSSTQIAKRQVNKKIDAEIETAVFRIECDLDCIDELLELQKYTNDGIKPELSLFEDSVKNEIKDDIVELGYVYENFSESVYSRLKEYHLQISSQITKDSNESYTEISPNMTVDVSIDGIIGGLGLGALILLFINPATLVAALAVGWLFRSALLERMKTNVKAKVQEGLTKAGEAVGEKWQTALDNTKNNYLTYGKNLMNDYQKRYAEIFQRRKAEDSKERERVQAYMSRVNTSLQEIDMMESVLGIPGKSNTDVEERLLEKVLCGDYTAASQIADKYHQMYVSSKNEEYNDCYKRWYAFSSLLRNKSSGMLSNANAKKIKIDTSERQIYFNRLYNALKRKVDFTDNRILEPLDIMKRFFEYINGIQDNSVLYSDLYEKLESHTKNPEITMCSYFGNPYYAQQIQNNGFVKMNNAELVMDEAKTGVPALEKELYDCNDEVNRQRMIAAFRYMNKVFQECKTRYSDHPNVQTAEIYLNMMHDSIYVRKNK